MVKSILVVEDDRNISDVICFALEKAGYRAVVAPDGLAAVTTFKGSSFDFIVLDVGLPELDGLEVCRQIRCMSEVPILFLSARDEEIDRILGLEIGGDDYVTKPFSPRELVARVSAILRRGKLGMAREGEEDDCLHHGDLVLKPEAFTARINQTALGLTKLEFSILHILVKRPTMVFERSRILDLAYPDNIHVSDRTIDSHIRNLRAKFAKVGCEDVIETVHGVGFRIGACSHAGNRA
nr:response regulator transcription factor [Roseibium sp. TrichSKD4]